MQKEQDQVGDLGSIMREGMEAHSRKAVVEMVRSGRI